MFSKKVIHHLRRSIAIFLCLAIVFLNTDFCAIAEGQSLDQITWQYDETTKCLTISGSGDIPDFESGQDENMPWHDIRYVAESVVVEEGITGIGDYGLTCFPAATSLVLPSTMTRIGFHGISYWSNLEKLELPANLSFIGDCAFSNCDKLELYVYCQSATFNYCSFGMSWSDDAGDNIVNPDSVLHGFSGSTAQSYAQQNSITFVPIAMDAVTGSVRRTEKDKRTDALGIVHITNEEQLRQITQNMYGEYMLDCDITLTSPWIVPDGNFGGSIDGQGHSINGLVINNDCFDGVYVGFFSTFTGTLSNISLNSVEITASDAEYLNCGVIAGEMNGGRLLNCNVSGTIEASASYCANAGGFFANQNSGYNSAENCAADITINVESGVTSAVCGISPIGMNRIRDCQVNCNITLTQTSDSGDGSFSAAGIMGASLDSAHNCTVSGTISLNAKKPEFAHAFGLYLASDSINNAEISCMTESGEAMSSGASDCCDCQNTGNITASSVNGTGNASGLFNASGENIENSGAIHASSQNSTAYAYGIYGNSSACPSACTNSGTVTASGRETNAHGLVNCAYSRNQGTVTGINSGSDILGSWISGILQCSHSVNSGNVSAINGNTAKAMGCRDCTDCKNEGSVTVSQNTGLFSSGNICAEAYGIDKCTDSLNTGSVSAAASGYKNSYVAAYGHKDCTNSESNASVSAESDYFYQYTGENGTVYIDCATVISSNSTSVHASVGSAYNVSASNGGSVSVYAWIRNHSFIGCYLNTPVNHDGDEYPISYLRLATYNSDGNSNMEWEMPNIPENSGSPDVYCESGGFFYEADENASIISLKYSCGSYLFYNGHTPSLDDPITTDYSKLYMRIVMYNSGNADSEETALHIILPEGFSFSEEDLNQAEKTFQMPALQSGQRIETWLTVYPLYAPEREGDYSLDFNWSVEGGGSGSLPVENAYVMQLGEKPDYAKIIYPVLGAVESAYYTAAKDGDELFRYYHWNAADFCGSEEQYKLSVNRLSSLLCTLSYLAYSAENEPIEHEEVLLKDYAALGFSEIEVSGDNKVYDSRRIIAKKRFYHDGEVRELVVVSIIGTANLVDDWLGNILYDSQADYHESFKGCADEVFNSLSEYITKHTEDVPKNLLITGHSRGGAVANLVGYEANQTLAEQFDTIRTYTYAAALCASDVKTKEAECRNIFNFKDFNDVVGFVPGCFSDYGVTFVFNHEKITNYSTYISIINQATKKPLIRAGNTANVAASVSLAMFMSSKVLYYHSMGNYTDALWDCDGSGCISMESALLQLEPLGTAITGSLFVLLNGLILRMICKLPEAVGAYIPYLLVSNNMCIGTDTAPVLHTLEDILFADGGALFRTDCPVDLTLYNEEGEVLVQIIDNQIVEADENLVTLVVGEDKTISLDDEETYFCRITGTDTGTMDCQLVTFDAETGEKASVTNCFDIPVEKNQKYTAVIQNGVMTVKDSEEQPVPGEILTGTEMDTIAIETVCSDETTYIGGTGLYTAGERAVLFAVNTEKDYFDGWYCNGELFSTEQVISVKCEKDMTLEPVFSNEPAERGNILKTAVINSGVLTVTLHCDSKSNVIISEYTDDNKLLKSQMIPADSSTREFTIPVNSGGAAQYKVFLVDESMHPTCDSLCVR